MTGRGGQGLATSGGAARTTAGRASTASRRHRPFAAVVVFALAVAVATIAPAAHALGTTRDLAEFSLDTWSTADGLPHNLVTSVAQTPEGYLWFGTWEGVVRYNGREFTVFDRAHVPSLRDNGVRNLQVGPDGALWVGTSRGGIARHAFGEWSALGQRDGLPSDEIMALGFDRHARLWIALESAGLATRDTTGAVRRLRASDGLAADSTSGLDVAGDVVWLAGARGVTRIADGRLRAYGVGDGLPPGDVNTVLVRADGTVWCGTERGVYRLRGERFEPVPEAAAIARSPITQLYEDRDRSLWIGTVTSGLARLVDGRLQQLTIADGLPNSRVAALFEDHEGSMWIGTNSGLVRLKEAPFSTYLQRHGLPDNYVRTVVEDADGTVWVGTSNGLGRRRGDAFTTLTTADGLSDNSVLSLATARDGALWIGTYASGVDVLHRGAIRHIGLADGLPGSQVRAIAQARDGAMWIGTSRGLARVADDGISRYGTADGLPRDYVMALFADRDGTLWVGTAHGMATVRDSRIETVRGVERYDVQDVFAFHQDADGVLWAATDRGLLVRRGDGFVQIGAAQSLPHETIFALIEDGQGWFWLSSNRGVFRVARKALLAVADGESTRLAGNVFAEADGMASAQCNGGSQPAALAARDGSLWFATARGLARVRGDFFTTSTPPPPRVVLEDVIIDETRMNPPRTLSLDPGARKVEFRFAALTYLSPQNVRYRYRLRPFEPDWLETKRLPTVQYTNLRPGDYRFEVSAADEQGPWNARALELPVTVRPAYWQTEWFALAAASALVLLAWAVYRARVVQLRARAARLERLVDERTRDIAAQKDQLLAADREKSALLQRIREQSEAFEQQAREDALTGLANRREFDARFAEAFAHCRAVGAPLAVALIDVDHFKRINDRHSHATGDAVLRAIGALLRRHARDGAFAARYGGEEFVIAFPRLDTTAARVRAEALRADVAAMRIAEAPALVVTASIGISGDADATHHERLLALADRALYRAKDGGRDRVEVQ